jgi:transcriptional regulator with XRE-family HTH domain
MDGRQLLKALMQAAGENPNSLADALGARTLQSQIARFIDGRTRNPRWSTLEPVAKHYGVKVEAFLDDEAAEAVALARGFLASEEASHLASQATAAPTPIRTVPRALSVHELIVQLGKALTGYDLPARKAVASLLADMAVNPEDAPRAADRIERLLGEPGNDLQPRSSSSNGG